MPDEPVPVIPELLATSPSDFVLVLNVRRLVELDNYTIAPGLELRRASQEELEQIRDPLLQAAWHPMPNFAWFWECDLESGTGEGHRPFLPEPQWRYFVVTSSHPGDPNWPLLQTAFDISPPGLELGPSFQKGWSSFCWAPTKIIHNILSPGIRFFFVDVTRSDLDATARLYGLLERHNNTLINVAAAGVQMAQLKDLSPVVPLRFLGYFAILESLLTHRPRPTDPYDSITRQVMQKLALLEHRWNPRLDLSPFKGLSFESLWKKMYQYRSALAHGDRPDFDGELQSLVGWDHALSLLVETVRAVLRQALEEPQLIADLRNC